ncbi:membrane protein [Microbacterium phage Morrigan]|nr:membrane protein [Microbacterium phage Morrigan]
MEVLFGFALGWCLYLVATVLGSLIAWALGR